MLVEELVRRGKHQNCNRYDLNLYSGAFENIIQQVEKYPDISGSRLVVLKDWRVRCTPPQVKPKPGSSSKPHFQGVNPLLVLLHPGRSSPDNFFYHLCVKRCLWNRSWNWSSLCLQKGWWFLLRFRGKSEICRRSPWDFHKFQKWWSSDQVHAVTRQKITAFNERLGKQAVQKGFPPTRVTRGQRLDD